MEDFMNICGNCGDAKDSSGLCSCPIGSKEVYSENAKLRAEVERLKREDVETRKAAITMQDAIREAADLQISVLQKAMEKIASTRDPPIAWNTADEALAEVGVIKMGFHETNEKSNQ